MNQKLEKVTIISRTIKYFMALLFLVSGCIKAYQREEAVPYFLLGVCFLIISSGKKIWDRKKDED